MWLLDWLITRFSSVADWFGNAYWSTRNYIANLPNTISGVIAIANQWFIIAVNQIQVKINNFYYQYISPPIEYVKNKINEHGGLLNWLRDSINNAIASIALATSNTFNNVIHWAISRYDNWITNIEANLSRFIAEQFPNITALLNFRARIDAWVTDIMKRLSGIDVANLKQFYDSTKTNVTAFASNPLGFIFDLLWVNGINFFCYLLGYGLGATIYTLPPRPNWNTATTGQSNATIPHTGNLSNPVTNPYVSGYTFDASHKGVDLGIAMGQTIFAMHDGVITFADWSTVGYGFCITIDGGQYWSRYAHLESFLVSNGQQVQAGQAIALGDSTGNSTGAHLHLELKVNGIFVDPLNYLQ